MSPKLRGIEVVEDRSAKSRCDEGFLRLRRLTLRNRYDDGSSSADYPCDVVSRPGSDAVVAVLYERGPRGVRVVLRESPRAPIYLRKDKTFEQADDRVYLTLLEVVAGIIEPGDGGGPEGLCRRAAAEVREEAGFAVPPEALSPIGDATFASPGTSDEKVYYTAVSVPVEGARLEHAPGDGSVMEECAQLVVRELREAIAACRNGGIPDMKTEIALLRLADHLGYIPQLDCFACDLPDALRSRYRSLGVE